MDIDLQEEEVSANVESKAKAGDVTIDNVIDLELECNVTDVNMEEMAQDDDTNTLREDVLVETEDENNINVREVLELEDEMAQDHMNTKRKDVFEETAEVVNNVSDVQEEELVESNLSSNSSKKFKSKSLKVECGIPGCKANNITRQS